MKYLKFDFDRNTFYIDNKWDLGSRELSKNDDFDIDELNAKIGTPVHYYEVCYRNPFTSERDETYIYDNEREAQAQLEEMGGPSFYDDDAGGVDMYLSEDTRNFEHIFYFFDTENIKKILRGRWGTLTENKKRRFRESKDPDRYIVVQYIPGNIGFLGHDGLLVEDHEEAITFDNWIDAATDMYYWVRSDHTEEETVKDIATGRYKVQII